MIIKKYIHIHRVINAQWHAEVGLCTLYILDDFRILDDIENNLILDLGRVYTTSLGLALAYILTV
jgi:hypothetical protein